MTSFSSGVSCYFYFFLSCFVYFILFFRFFPRLYVRPRLTCSEFDLKSIVSIKKSNQKRKVTMKKYGKENMKARRKEEDKWRTDVFKRVICQHWNVWMYLCVSKCWDSKRTECITGRLKWVSPRKRFDQMKPREKSKLKWTTPFITRFNKSDIISQHCEHVYKCVLNVSVNTIEYNWIG